jgi:hypothetical protein
MIGFIGFVCTVPMFLVGVFDDPDERQTVDLSALMDGHHSKWKGTISLRKGGYRF